jgi:hypothetical protein
MGSSANAEEKEHGLSRVPPIPGRMDGETLKTAALQTNFDAREIPDSEDELSPFQSPVETSRPALAKIDPLKAVPEVSKHTKSPIATGVIAITLMPEEVQSEQVLDNAEVSKDAKPYRIMLGEIADTDSEGEDVIMESAIPANKPRASEKSQSGNITTSPSEEVKQPCDSSDFVVAGTQRPESKTLQSTDTSAISDHIEGNAEEPTTSAMVIIDHASIVQAPHIQVEYTSDDVVPPPSETVSTSPKLHPPSPDHKQAITGEDVPTETVSIEAKSTNVPAQLLTPEQKRLVSLPI